MKFTSWQATITIMCYAAMARPDLEECLREYDATLDVNAFELLFWERVNNPKAGIKFPIAIDRYFLQSKNKNEARIRDAIKAYREAKMPQWQQEVFKQRKRYADAQRALEVKHTKTAEKELGIASRLIERHLGWLNSFKTMTNEADDTAVHSMNYAPIIVQTEQGRMLTAMRYHCRLAGKPSSIDRALPGLYNARKTSLQDWWAPIFGVRHAVFLMMGFRENVKRHDMEHRELMPDEAPENVVLQFVPQTHQPMMVPCVWDRWDHDGNVLNSFALITDDPPPEVAAAGHDRCPINLTRTAAESWLSPRRKTVEGLLDLLEDRQRPLYEYFQAAA
jgi:putative SOS response-associated peptidase YedK